MRLGLAILLSCLSLIASAQEAWPGDWQGDTAEYSYENGVLMHRDNGVAGTATISRPYQPTDPKNVTWEFKTIFLSPPTSQNSFSIQLFQESIDNYRYSYTLEPQSNGTHLTLFQIIEEQKSNGQWQRLSTRTLDSHSFHFASTAWLHLQVRVDYSSDKGIRLQTFTPHGELKQGEWKETRHGKIIWEIVLTKRFTSKKKLEQSLTLPTLSTAFSNDDIDLSINHFEVEEIGRVTLTLNNPVDASNASVICEGFQPTLMHGSTPDQLTINLGARFAPNRTYDFTITGLKTLQGHPKELYFTVETSREEDPNTMVPKGLFITEIMASPPENGPLRGVKYIELYNNSGSQVQLSHLQLLYGKTKYPFPAITLADNSFAIIYLESDPYPTNNATLVPLSTFPALSSSFTLTLMSIEGYEYDHVNFSSRLYGEGAPKGGASIERVAYNPGLWRRSNHPDGGTPGKKTTLRPHKSVPYKSLIVNEIMLSPGTNGEKYLELYNRSDHPINLSDLYLTYTNKEESFNSSSWLLTQDEVIIKPKAYITLCPFPETLERLYRVHDSNTFIERIDFPSISPTYSEVSLKRHTDDEVIDQIIYRKQWLGSQSTDRTGYSLERVNPDADGRLRESWMRALENGTNKGTGGTPGVLNSTHNLTYEQRDPNISDEWPQEPELTTEQLKGLLTHYSHIATLEVFSMSGDMLMKVCGSKITTVIQQLSEGKAPLPTCLVAIRLLFKDEDRDPSELRYRSIWAHNICQ